ncbi:MAG: hypothetical protein CL983_07315 [Euryarchaeota archaeon]|nr:hypothetical protein [Euryarchaeota archaeon]|tara:strand:+ start:275 stop:928 length:654 start_codon:yes stop_codon:yes gene_type:complete
MSSLRFLQLKATPEQAKLLPGNQLMDIFDQFETISTISIKGVFPELLFRVTFKNPKALEQFDQLAAFEITEILEKNDVSALLTAYTKGPVPMLIHSNPETWIHTPSTISKHSGLFLTVLGTTKGLKKFRDEILQLLPPSIKISISKNLKGRSIAAPKLPKRRGEIVRIAVKNGYYQSPRKCKQRDLAEILGIKQGTVAEHLQYAESSIMSSWVNQSK